MGGLVRIGAAIDRATTGLGRTVSWLALAMILLGAWNAVARHLGRDLGVPLASNALIEAQWYCFSVLFLLAAPWALARDAHVRVDVLRSRLGPRTRAVIDLAGTVVLLIPTCIAMLVLSWPAVRSSVALREVSPDPGGLPRWPLKLTLLVAFALLLLQGVAEAIRRVAYLKGRLERPEAGDPSELPDGMDGAA